MNDKFVVQLSYHSLDGRQTPWRKSKNSYPFETLADAKEAIRLDIKERQFVPEIVYETTKNLRVK
jgi:hypothetical protein